MQGFKSPLNIDLRKKRLEFTNRKLKQMFLQPAGHSCLTPRLTLNSERRLKCNLKYETTTPEIISLSSQSKDLISPHSSKNKGFMRDTHENSKYKSDSLILPKFPSTQLRLQQLIQKHKIPSIYCIEGSKKTINMRNRLSSNTRFIKFFSYSKNKKSTLI